MLSQDGNYTFTYLLHETNSEQLFFSSLTRERGKNEESIDYNVTYPYSCASSSFVQCSSESLQPVELSCFCFYYKKVWEYVAGTRVLV